MGKHATHQPGRGRRIPRSSLKIAVSGAVLAVWASAGSIALGQADTGSSASAAAADTASVRTFACPGRQLEFSRSSDSAADLACRYGVESVGRMQADVARQSATGRTGLPEGTTEGTLLVATVQTGSSSTVSMNGWTKAYDTVSGSGGVRLSAWYRYAARDERGATAAVTPAGNVSMITSVFTGTDRTAPIGSSASAPGLSTPMPAVPP